ncbi:MAG: nucleotidyltransferase family protein [Anaerolineae bacterium]|jgi:predicted nucleotidyltransferase
MIALVEEKRHELEALCRRFNVRQLDLFGSAARGGFDAVRSDLDFVVQFEALDQGEHGRAYFGLLLALQDLFERDVDLVILSSVQNPYLLEEILETRRVVYAAAA